jgi:hypothetical protein
VFPQHFPRTGGPANDTTAERPQQPAAMPAETSRESAVHRLRLSAALQKRLFPETTLQPPELAQRIDVEVPTLLDWIHGRAEPSSYQLGRLIAALDPTFLVDVYGEDVEVMGRRFEAAVAETREAEARARAALEILRGGTR